MITKRLLLLIVILGYQLTALAADRLLPYEKWETHQGIPVYFAKVEQLPMVDINVVFRAGSSVDGKHYGIANITSQLLREGTVHLDANKLGENLSKIGAQLNVSADHATAAVHLRSLTDTRSLQPGLALLIQTIASPAFTQNDVTRVKNNTINAIKIMQQKPDYIANKELFKIIYKGSPYAHPVLGKLSTISHINRDLIKSFYSQYYTASNAAIIIVGNLTTQEAKRIATQISHRIPKGQAAKISEYTNQNPHQNPHKIRINHYHPGPQTSIILGKIGIDHHDPDFFSLKVANHILGGGLTSRLAKNVREKRGLSYGIYSYFRSLPGKGPFVIGLQTRNDQTNEALKVVNDTLKEFIKDGPTDTELKEAKQYLTGSFPLHLSSNMNLVALLTLLWSEQLPEDFFENFQKNLDDVTAQQAHDAFNRHVNPTQLVTVTVGGR